MARPRSFLRNWAEFILFRLALASLSNGPREWSLALGKVYASILRVLIPRWSRIASRNLALAFPDAEAAARERILSEVFESLGRVITLFARFPHINASNVGDWIRMEGFEHVQRGLARGRGVMVATGHLGNWEFSAFAFALLEQPMSVVVRPLDNPLIDCFVARYRSSSGNRIISKHSPARAILAALGRNEMVGVLVDQNFQSGVFVDYFGVPAATAPGFARLAEHSGASVVPGFAVWRADERKYVLRFYPELQMSGDPVRDTQIVQSAIERAVRESPGQWLWIHRRWKTRPAP